MIFSCSPGGEDLGPPRERRQAAVTSACLLGVTGVGPSSETMLGSVACGGTMSLSFSGSLGSGKALMRASGMTTQLFTRSETCLKLTDKQIQAS